MVVVDDVVSMTACHLFGTERETVLLGPGTLDSFAIRTARSDDIIERKIDTTFPLMCGSMELRNGGHYRELHQSLYVFDVDMIEIGHKYESLTEALEELHNVLARDVIRQNMARQ